MNAELIAVGTELLLGDTINTDAAAVARLLSELGINVYWQTVVGDNRARLEQAVQLARTRADLIITTGGLGPTCDDLTKEVVAGAFGIPLELNKAEEERLRGLYRERRYLHDGKSPAAGHAAARLHRAAKRLGHSPGLRV